MLLALEDIRDLVKLLHSHFLEVITLELLEDIMLEELEVSILEELEAIRHLVWHLALRLASHLRMPCESLGMSHGGTHLQQGLPKNLVQQDLPENLLDLFRDLEAMSHLRRA